MKIIVERTNTPEGDLVFTIKVSNPHDAPFKTEELETLKSLESCYKSLKDISVEESKFKTDVENSIYDIKEKAFLRVIRSLKFSIDNQLRFKFNPICQEIYNWIYDYQNDSLKAWMLEFDPQRTKYYFDNDTTIENDMSEEYEL